MFNWASRSVRTSRKWNERHAALTIHLAETKKKQQKSRNLGEVKKKSINKKWVAHRVLLVAGRCITRCKAVPRESRETRPGSLSQRSRSWARGGVGESRDPRAGARARARSRDVSTLLVPIWREQEQLVSPPAAACTHAALPSERPLLVSEGFQAPRSLTLLCASVCVCVYIYICMCIGVCMYEKAFRRRCRSGVWYNDRALFFLLWPRASRKFTTRVSCRVLEGRCDDN